MIKICYINLGINILLIIQATELKVEDFVHVLTHLPLTALSGDPQKHFVQNEKEIKKDLIIFSTYFLIFWEKKVSHDFLSVWMIISFTKRG